MKRICISESDGQNITASENMMKLLVDNGAALDAVNKFGNTALILAVSKGNLKMF